MSSGDVRVPATFYGTARLLDGTEAPTPPGLTRHDDLQGEFHAELDISFDLLVGLGFKPVDPSHPAYPCYLAASASRKPASASPEPMLGIDPHAPDAVVVLAPPPHQARASSGAAPPAPFGDFEAFLDFLGDPGRDEADDAADAGPFAASGRNIGLDHPSGIAPAGNVSGAASTAPATAMPALVLPSLAAALPSPVVASAASVVSPAAGAAASIAPSAAAKGLAADGAEAVSAAGAAVLSSGAPWLAPAAVLLAPNSTAAADTLTARGIPIGPPPRGTRVDVAISRVT